MSDDDRVLPRAAEHNRGILLAATHLTEALDAALGLYEDATRMPRGTRHEYAPPVRSLGYGPSVERVLAGGQGALQDVLTAVRAHLHAAGVVAAEVDAVIANGGPLPSVADGATP